MKARSYYFTLALFVSICISASTFGQEINGNIRDRTNLKAMTYASIFYKKANIGIYSDSSGNFKIQRIKGDTLIVSALGYEKFMIPTDGVKDFLSISLSPASISLNEVTIKGNKTVKSMSGKKLYLGNVSGKRESYTSGMKGRTIAYLIKTDASITGQIKSIQYGIDAKAAAMVRIHLYTIDATTAMPGIDLLKSPLLLKVKNGAKHIDVDIDNLDIDLPLGGLFVGLEWVGEINNTNHLNISPTYTQSISSRPITEYVRFFDRDWELSPTRWGRFRPNDKRTSNQNSKPYHEPNIKMTLVQ
jgi:hypothetical protein